MQHYPILKAIREPAASVKGMQKPKYNRIFEYFRVEFRQLQLK